MILQVSSKHSEPIELESRVFEWMQKGYVPLGAPFHFTWKYTPEDTRFQHSFCQAMVLKELECTTK